MTRASLVLNAGSSSLKFAVYKDGPGTRPAVLRGRIAGIGTEPVFSARDEAGRALPEDQGMQLEEGVGYDPLMASLLDWLNSRQGGVTIAAAGHRVVHGGRDHASPARVDAALLTELATLSPLAPLHQPHNLAAIRAVAAAMPGLPQVACFDTSFHHTQARLSKLFALPRALTEKGIIRYGFHGLSYDYIAGILPDHLDCRAEGRVIVAHLGNGASMCAMKARRSVATSMGFTALAGLMMGQRCGTLDPGIVLYLIREVGMAPEAVEHMLYQESGLLGVSGISNDVELLQASAEPSAREAIDLFCERAACELAALAVTIAGLDAIIFTAGIGENSALVRRLICDRLTWMGVVLDGEANGRSAVRISSPASAVDVLVLPTDEEAVIARSTQALLALQNDEVPSGQIARA
jgi:acetate kinase